MLAEYENIHLEKGLSGAQDMKAREETSGGVPLEIQLLGTLKVRIHGSPLPHLRSRQAQWLLGLLALRSPAETERGWLASLLWPESSGEQALYNLRRNLTDLRQALGPERDRLTSPSAR